VLNNVIAFALKNRVFIVAAALLISFYGAYTALRLPIDVLPDLNRPTVTIMAEAHAMVPEDVERLVTQPIEQALNGATGVTRVRSASGLGLGVIQIEFGWETDIYRNRQIVQEKLQLAQARLPKEVDVQMAPISSIMGQIQLVGVKSKSGKTDISDIRALCDLNIRPRLMSLAGVAQVVTIGGAARQLQITVDPNKLRIHNVTMMDVVDAVKSANVNASGGFITIGAKGPVVTVTGRVAVQAEIASAVIKSDAARPVTVGDVAAIDFGPAAIKSGDAGINGNPGVIMVVFKQPGVDTVALTERVQKELNQIQKTLPLDYDVIGDLFQQADFIHRAIKNVFDAVRDGAVLVVVILIIFLLNFRTTFITLTAIPLSIAMTAIIFAAFGLSINTMTLGGIAVAIGALVDDAIVDVENVFRRLRHNATLPQPVNPLRVIFQASSEVRKPIVIGTLLVVVVYLPLFYLSGLEGRMFTPIGIAYIISVLASLVVSMTVTPVLCYYLLGKSVTAKHADDGWLVRQLKKLSGLAIRFSLKFPMPILAALIASVAIGVMLLATQGSAFLPTLNEGVSQVNLILPPDTGLEASNQFGQRLEKLLTGVKGVKHVARRTGRAEGDEHAEGVNASEAITTYDPAAGRKVEEIKDEIRTKLAIEFPGAATEVDQPLSHLLSHLLSGVNAQVAVKVFGPDLEVLRRTADQIEAALKPIPGVKDLYKQSQIQIEQLAIKPNRDAMKRYGVSVKDVGELVEMSGGGEEVSRMIVGQASYPIVVTVAQKSRNDLAGIRALQLRAANGDMIRLSDVADVDLVKTPNNINHENVSRRTVVQCNVAGRSLGEVVADVEKVLDPIRAKLATTPEYAIRVSGQFEAQAEATRLIFILSIISFVAMFLILYMHFKSVNLSAQVLLSIPMAFVGAVVYIVVSKQTMTVATLVGLISLGGIAARNSILLIDHYIHLMREEREPFSEAMIIRAGQERMVPVLMTALCSGIALVPLVLTPDEPGREILYPVATVILGGLISSTLLDFIVTPGVFWTFGKRGAERIATPHHLDRAAEDFSDDVSVEPPTLKGDIAHG